MPLEDRMTLKQKFEQLHQHLLKCEDILDDIRLNDIASVNDDVVGAFFDCMADVQNACKEASDLCDSESDEIVTSEA